MQTSDIREKLHEYVESSDEKLLKLMYVLAKEYQTEDVQDHYFTEKYIAEFDQRRQRHLSGESKTYNWQEAKAFITGQNKLDGL